MVSFYLGPVRTLASVARKHLISISWVRVIVKCTCLRKQEMGKGEEGIKRGRQRQRQRRRARCNEDHVLWVGEVGSEERLEKVARPWKQSEQVDEVEMGLLCGIM